LCELTTDAFHELDVHAHYESEWHFFLI
jgi:hypothetical protein